MVLRLAWFACVGARGAIVGGGDSEDGARERASPAPALIGIRDTRRDRTCTHVHDRDPPTLVSRLRLIRGVF